VVEFEWDPNKASQNLLKHSVSFNEAATVFADPLSIDIFDPNHSVEEARHIIVGVSSSGRFLLAAYTHRGARIRIISARQMTRSERRDYEDEVRNRQG
jgi:hypothetical protein